MSSALFKKLRIDVDLFKWKSEKTTQASQGPKSCVIYVYIPCVNDQGERVIDLIENLFADCTNEVL